eukprot:SAG31_NODE_24698_length_476_cov_0.684350_1_plen_133_part_01
MYIAAAYVYCCRYAMQLQPWRAPHIEVFDSLQLGKGGCNLSRPTAAAPKTAGSTRPPGVGKAIFADAVHGNDVSGRGTVGAPFRSVIRALYESRAQKAKTITLRAGTYHMASENSSPLQLGPEDSGLHLTAML